jgi:hypothetical protein
MDRRPLDAVFLASLVSDLSCVIEDVDQFGNVRVSESQGKVIIPFFPIRFAAGKTLLDNFAVFFAHVHLTILIDIQYFTKVEKVPENRGVE